ncbi:SdrD B-like domain-containing protein [Arsenicibacter rosenii]|uniref:SdrD B-like domain-containing protein n=1 Tax=Arsenicibacter rosenii TaxID=1750698 RepID=UPI0008F8B2D0|nr:SdrD B-like domain-containing protein [Arsenicibacter rosenii]
MGGGYLSADLKAQTISGVVYRDFNSDGLRTAPANATGVSAGDVGVPGIIVTAYSSNTATSPLSVTTSSTGTYTLTTGAGQFRIEFTNLPQGDQSSFRGTGNGTNVQFVTVAASVTGVNFGINYPQNYCSTQNPEVITTCFVSGTPTTATPVTNTALAGGRDVIVGVPYSTTGDARPTHASIANALAVGSVWGLAYKKTTRQLFTAAFQKRHVGYGPGGAGAIYVTTLAADLQSGTTAATPFFNFSSVAGAGPALHGTLSTSAGEASYDIQSFSLVGKVGLGDIDISDDEQYLYVVNLFNRRLYQITIATKDTVSFSIPNNCSTGTSYRPFAVKYHRGKVYVGVVCTREDLIVADTNNDGVADTYGPTTGLQGTVYAFGITGSTATTAVALSFPMNYLKAPTNADYSAITAPQARAEYWRPWTNNFRADRLTGANPVIASYPQPWLTDIEFDVNGDMILGVRDRFGDQMGYQNYFPISSRTDFVSVISPGEILRAGKCTAADSWTIESNGSTCTIPSNTTAQTAGQGPGNGKFYWGDRVQQGANHQLSSLGGLAVLGGSGQVIMTAMDPNDIFNTGGIKRLVNATGAKAGESFTTSSPTAGFYLYTDNDITSYGKANGIGDVELLCGPAPIQIGNRVWFDQNQNGIQDPGEQPVAGAVVQLYNSAKTTVLASVTTNAAGEYYFSSASSSTVTSTSAAVTTALTYNTSYAVVISSLGTGTVVTGNFLSLTSVSPRIGESTSINSGTTISNNDAVVETGRPCVRFTTGSDGGAVHNFDFGLTAPCYLSLTVTPGACSSVTNQYTLSGTVNFTNTTAGSVTVTVGTASAVLSVSAATTSLPFTLTGLTSGAGLQTAAVLSSASACGAASLTFNAPASCTVPASVTASSATVCAGSPASLTATGCPGTIQWAGTGITGGANTSVVSVSTSASLTVQTVVSYTATCVLYSSTAVSVGTVTIVPVPSLTLTASSLTVVQGSMITLTTQGCTFGTITGSVSGSSAQVMVTGTTNVYSVTCTNQPNCTGTASVTVTGLPSTSLVVSSTTVCAGQPASLTAIGCTNTVTFNNPGAGTVTGNVLTVQTSAGTTALTTLSYVATCTTNVETTTAVGTITVVPTPDVTITAQRSTSTNSVTLTASGCQNGTLLWSTGESTASIVIASGALTLYSVTCTTGPDCRGTDQVRIGLVPPVLDVLVTGGIICGNQSATLTANGCTANLLWSTGETTAAIVVNPAVTTVYSASCSDDITTVTGSATVTVQGSPAIALTASSPGITPGQSVTITATGCVGGTLVWSTGSTANGMMSLVDSPTATTTYTATCTTGPQCQSVATVTVMVMAPQTPLLTVTKLVSASRARLGDIISYTIVLANTGTGEATNVQVRDSVSYGLEILTASVMPSVGTYSPGSPVSVWVVPSLPANSTATFTFSASVTAEGVVYNKASVPGSTASVCTTIPIRVCQGTDYAFLLNAPEGYVRYQWFRRATPTSSETLVYDGTLSSFTVTRGGEYRVVVNDVQGQCPDLSCCPFIVEEDSIPQFTVMAQSPTCLNTQPQGNGSLTIMGLGTDPTQFTYQVSAGATFTPGAALPGVAATVPANGVILSNLNTTQTYTVRVYNQQGCYRDVTVTLTVNCACPPQVCVPVTIRRTRLVNP